MSSSYHQNIGKDDEYMSSVPSTPQPSNVNKQGGASSSQKWVSISLNEMRSAGMSSPSMTPVVPLPRVVNVQTPAPPRAWKSKATKQQQSHRRPTARPMSSPFGNNTNTEDDVKTPSNPSPTQTPMSKHKGWGQVTQNVEKISLLSTEVSEKVILTAPQVTQQHQQYMRSMNTHASNNPQSHYTSPAAPTHRQPKPEKPSNDVLVQNALASTLPLGLDKAPSKDQLVISPFYSVGYCTNFQYVGGVTVPNVPKRSFFGEIAQLEVNLGAGYSIVPNADKSSPEALVRSITIADLFTQASPLNNDSALCDLLPQLKQSSANYVPLYPHLASARVTEACYSTQDVLPLTPTQQLVVSLPRAQPQTPKQFDGNTGQREILQELNSEMCGDKTLHLLALPPGFKATDHIALGNDMTQFPVRCRLALHAATATMYIVDVEFLPEAVYTLTHPTMLHYLAGLIKAKPTIAPQQPVSRLFNWECMFRPPTLALVAEELDKITPLCRGSGISGTSTSTVYADYSPDTSLCNVPAPEIIEEGVDGRLVPVLGVIREHLYIDLQLLAAKCIKVLYKAVVKGLSHMEVLAILLPDLTRVDLTSAEKYVQNALPQICIHDQQEFLHLCTYLLSLLGEMFLLDVHAGLICTDMNRHLRLTKATAFNSDLKYIKQNYPFEYAVSDHFMFSERDVLGATYLPGTNDIVVTTPYADLLIGLINATAVHYVSTPLTSAQLNCVLTIDPPVPAVPHIISGDVSTKYPIFSDIHFNSKTALHTSDPPAHFLIQPLELNPVQWPNLDTLSRQNYTYVGPFIVPAQTRFLGVVINITKNIANVELFLPSVVTKYLRDTLSLPVPVCSCAEKVCKCLVCLGVATVSCYSLYNGIFAQGSPAFNSYTVVHNGVASLASLYAQDVHRKISKGSLLTLGVQSNINGKQKVTPPPKELLGKSVASSFHSIPNSYNPTNHPSVTGTHVDVQSRTLHNKICSPTFLASVQTLFPVLAPVRPPAPTTANNYKDMSIFFLGEIVIKANRPHVLVRAALSPDSIPCVPKRDPRAPDARVHELCPYDAAPNSTVSLLWKFLENIYAPMDVDNEKMILALPPSSAKPDLSLVDCYIKALDKIFPVTTMVLNTFANVTVPTIYPDLSRSIYTDSRDPAQIHALIRSIQSFHVGDRVLCSVNLNDTSLEIKDCLLYAPIVTASFTPSTSSVSHINPSPTVLNEFPKYIAPYRAKMIHATRTKVQVQCTTEESQFVCANARLLNQTNHSSNTYWLLSDYEKASRQHSWYRLKTNMCEISTHLLHVQYPALMELESASKPFHYTKTYNGALSLPITELLELDGAQLPLSKIQKSVVMGMIRHDGSVGRLSITHAHERYTILNCPGIADITNTEKYGNVFIDTSLDMHALISQPQLLVNNPIAEFPSICLHQVWVGKYVRGNEQIVEKFPPFSAGLAPMPRAMINALQSIHEVVSGDQYYSNTLEVTCKVYIDTLEGTTICREQTSNVKTQINPYTNRVFGNKNNDMSYNNNNNTNHYYYNNNNEVKSHHEDDSKKTDKHPSAPATPVKPAHKSRVVLPDNLIPTIDEKKKEYSHHTTKEYPTSNKFRKEETLHGNHHHKTNEPIVRKERVLAKDRKYEETSKEIAPKKKFEKFDKQEHSKKHADNNKHESRTNERSNTHHGKETHHELETLEKPHGKSEAKFEKPPKREHKSVDKEHKQPEQSSSTSSSITREEKPNKLDRKAKFDKQVKNVEDNTTTTTAPSTFATTTSVITDGKKKKFEKADKKKVAVEENNTSTNTSSTLVEVEEKKPKRENIKKTFKKDDIVIPTAVVATEEPLNKPSVKAQKGPKKPRANNVKEDVVTETTSTTTDAPAATTSKPPRDPKPKNNLKKKNTAAIEETGVATITAPVANTDNTAPEEGKEGKPRCEKPLKKNDRPPKNTTNAPNTTTTTE